AQKLAPCGIALLDTPQEVVPAALAYLGRDPKSHTEADLADAIALIDRLRPYVRKFHSSRYINDLATGDICVAIGYSGDVIQARNRAREAESPVEIGFRVPREGAQMSIDMLGIPADAPHPDNAHAFIDYILRPDIIAAISNAVSYPNPNLAATPLRSEEHTSELQSRRDLVCRLLLEKKNVPCDAQGETGRDTRKRPRFAQGCGQPTERREGQTGAECGLAAEELSGVALNNRFSADQT